MKLAAVCCTYLRPGPLGRLIESFLRQDYPRELRELLILDDAGQYRNQEGDGWRLVSIPRRFRTLGEKRNACAALAPGDAEGLVVADDDDVYLPHWFRAHAEALRRADWSRPSLVLAEAAEGLREDETGGLFHAAWAFRRAAFDRVRGYAAVNNGEDQELAARLVAAGASQCDPCEFAPPYFVHGCGVDTYHLSWLGDRGYESLGGRQPDGEAEVRVGWPREYARLPVARRFAAGPPVGCNGGPPPVEMIGPINTPSGRGPENGMFTLQQALRAEIRRGGLDWLSIRPLPASDGAVPWFWHWEDRRYAAWWAADGRPFVQGPNVLFLNSATPRIDRDECAMLDAATCRAMFCHSGWYRELVVRHRGAENQCPVVVWPYPIDPRPGPPLPAEYDLLIYAKNGHRPQLVEHLSGVFPRHRVVHYGSYRREELFEAARRSAACAYLADDDHGPLALQEILLAGCPAVGVRTGAAFVRDGVTGRLVGRLPPGREALATEQDAAALDEFARAIDDCRGMDRRLVRDAAVVEFSTESIIDRVVAALDAARRA